ncbi:IucA/IucC family protein [Vibrio aquimaris]|uniref:N(2)-citryl-N(6)-acetyl-N(6)-hydroxylysine synthase n=1 Tax=Vibrio aquimaris TaxID=2587862 RepID=A0A5P9CIE3_9VIBR|nr:IucA/IucC family protein [Vibrio aquimaris]QFT25811.1 N(2)-citryl-N(6)-acetyl-N(6)-hydroxylysine synthase [Vibrio aquimaris]
MLNTQSSPTENLTQNIGLMGHKKTQLNHEKAQLNTIMSVVNCYLREYAIPNKHVIWGFSSASLPQTLKRNYGPSQLVGICLNEGDLLVLPVEYISQLGKVKLADRPWSKTSGSGWSKLDATQTLTLLLQYLKQVLVIPFNHELIDQMENSLVITEQFLNSEPNHQHHNRFIASEQSLIWGHSFHPTPKSRSGVSIDDLLICSPEVGTQVPLYWFKVDSTLLDVLQSDKRKTPQTMLDKLAPKKCHSKSTVLYPCHPWESYTILQNPVVKRAIDQGKITPLGLGGEKLLPTSSVRTLYHPDMDWFAKFSINVRLTNCVRKNAWYELDSAVQLTSILRSIKETEQLRNPVFKVMTEPYATTLNLESIAGLEHDDVIKARESFGILYRENFTQSETDILEPTLAGALFAYNRDGNSCIAKELTQKAKENQSQYEDIATLWFERYLHCLIPGVFNYYFKHGVAFEPHLQNTLIGFDEGMPCCVWIRDLEGTKLLAEFWPADSLNQLSERALQSVYYSREQGWNRIGYCTFINNISEAVFFICEGNSKLEQALWSILRDAIICWQSINGKQPELESLLDGGYFPSKNNFTTRLMQNADKESSYTQVLAPWTTRNKGESHD